jgi:hypothetical protein
MVGVVASLALMEEELELLLLLFFAISALRGPEKEMGKY